MKYFIDVLGPPPSPSKVAKTTKKCEVCVEGCADLIADGPSHEVGADREGEPRDVAEKLVQPAAAAAAAAF